jgi:Pyruvate/2-oxoacid:ferredoxin oxidoreductase delta subunit
MIWLDSLAPRSATMARNTTRRVVEVNRGVFGPAKPRPRTVRPKKITECPGVPAVHLQVAEKLSSPLLMGPPVCDELIAFVRHLFTEEEAGVVRHLGQFAGMSAADIARGERRPLDQIEPILHRLSTVKRAIAASGPEGTRKYRLMPIMPGIFEMVLIGESPEALSPWHRRFAELFEALYETGYTVDYQQGQTRPSPFVRVIPVGSTIDAHPMALPSDRLEVILDRYKVFGVGQCQCRMTMQVAGRGCGKPMGNCTVMGEFAEQGIRQGWLRPVSRKDVLAIKREAESHGLVTWIMNAEAVKGQASCSCCGCCCHALRIVNEFNSPGVMAPAHFLPRFDAVRCTYCGKCARTCPMGALVMDVHQRTRQHLAARCIGCDLCVVACDDHQAIAMEPVPDYKLPYQSAFSYQFHTAAGVVKNAWTAWRHR